MQGSGRLCSDNQKKTVWVAFVLDSHMIFWNAWAFLGPGLQSDDNGIELLGSVRSMARKYPESTSEDYQGVPRPGNEHCYIYKSDE